MGSLVSEAGTFSDVTTFERSFGSFRVYPAAWQQVVERIAVAACDEAGEHVGKVGLLVVAEQLARGCWAMRVGHFDSQLISVGMSQWNYGTGSMQPVLEQGRDSFGSRRRFRQARGLSA